MLTYNSSSCDRNLIGYMRYGCKDCNDLTSHTGSVVLVDEDADRLPRELDGYL